MTLGDDDQSLRFGPLSGAVVHLCVDMQRLFAEDTAWKTPWMARVAPRVEQIAASHPAATIFTRFIPADRPGAGNGTWERYWRRWADMTIERLGQDMISLIPTLARFVPPALIIDKHTYSPWLGSALEEELGRRGADTLIITGGETEVCVLSTVLGAIDRGFRILVVTDALCSSADETHDASMALYRNRYGQQVETVTTACVLREWR
jgi:nicotinamidase-related amidase